MYCKRKSVLINGGALASGSKKVGSAGPRSAPVSVVAATPWSWSAAVHWAAVSTACRCGTTPIPGAAMPTATTTKQWTAPTSVSIAATGRKVLGLCASLSPRLGSR